ncbi:MAG: hypothetical protein HKN58_05740, partial [Xanthomonadales bacterium]|nr:hypothetical protein [Xanthomonadales bacterium]
MDTSSQSLFVRIIKSVPFRIGIAALAVLAAVLWILSVRAVIDKIEYAMSPPKLPDYEEMETVHLNPEGWGQFDDRWFHHVSQGTATLPIPYEWLVALEAPSSSPWLALLGKNDPFLGEFALRLGFIKGRRSDENPDSLPVGIARTSSINFPGIERKADAVGFNCAACHTGQLVFDNRRYIVDGGPAMTDLGLLTRSLGAALGQTLLSSKLKVFNGRFERFAHSVLGSNDNVLTRDRLAAELDAVIANLAKTSDAIEVTEGFTRLDALNRIGNQVFAAAMDRPNNYSPINAPVNFPHIWDTSWFNWVQYDASIMQPLTRNTGEALGVKAFVDMTTGSDKATGNGKNERFASSVPVRTLVEIEDWIGGTHPLKAGNRFNGVQSPAWPNTFPAIDRDLAQAGAKLYKDNCQHCHLPPVNSDEFWEIDYWSPIEWSEN